jgi:hypothetical protein
MLVVLADPTQGAAVAAQDQDEPVDRGRHAGRPTHERQMPHSVPRADGEVRAPVAVLIGQRAHRLSQAQATRRALERKHALHRATVVHAQDRAPRLNLDQTCRRSEGLVNRRPAAARRGSARAGKQRQPNHGASRVWEHAAIVSSAPGLRQLARPIYESRSENVGAPALQGSLASADEGSRVRSRSERGRACPWMIRSGSDL